MNIFLRLMPLALSLFLTVCNESPIETSNPRRERWDPNFVAPEETNRWVKILLQSGVVTDTLTPGQDLLPNQGLISKDGRFVAIFQDDSNFVIYYKNRAIWASNTYGQNGVRLAFQVDGNMVIYRADNTAIWSPNTYDQGAVAAVLSNTGSLSIQTADKRALWTSGTCCYPPAVPADPRPISAGKWGPKVDWPLISIHAVLMPSGKVFTFGTDAQGVQGAQIIYDIWDPSLGTGANSHTTLPNTTKTDMFCAAPTILPATGDIIIPGGDARTPTANIGIKDTLLLSTTTQTLSRAPYLSFGRWYETATTLPNGDIFVFGGIDGNYQAPPTPEIYSATSGWRSLFGATNNEIFNGPENKWWYPRNWVAPDGRIFGMTGDKMYYVNLGYANGQMTILPAALPPYSRSFTSSAVMYSPGKIIQLGGTVGGNTGGRASDGAIEVDITGGNPVVSKLNPMAYDRSWPTATVLPNGEVFVSGGAAYDNQLVDVALTSEIWNPLTKNFRPVAAAQLARLYHSTALLLPDGSVLVSGGGAPGPLVNLNSEIYYPPYLFDSAGNFVERLQIVGANAREDYANVATMSFTGPGTVARVTLVKTGAVTHSFNMEQRFIELPFTVQGNTVKVVMPTNPNIATPGYYLLHFLDEKGVPSPGKLIGLGTGLPEKNILNPGDGLNVNESLLSPDKNARLTLRADGNLVLTYKGQPLWNAGTVGATRLAMQADGNLVLYAANGAAVWSSNTWGNQNAGGRLVLRSDGNLVLQKATAEPFWQTNTCCHNRQRDTMFPGDELLVNEKLKSADLRTELVLNADGNLVLSHQGAISWNAGAAGKGAVKAVMQTDGSLVLSNAAGAPVWSTNTGAAGNGGSILLLQNDANMVIYRPNATATWASNTCCQSPVRDTLLPGQSLGRGERLTSPDKRTTLDMQPDGHLVLYHQNQAIWASQTYLQPGVEVVMQPDGNLVLYTETKRALWSSQTWGGIYAGGRLVLRNDANLVIQIGNAAPYWQTNTCCR